MITLTSKESPQRDLPTMTRAELDTRWREAKSLFDQALALKIETDRAYQAAANELNSLERLVRKMEKRAAQAEREANRLIRQLA